MIPFVIQVIESEDDRAFLEALYVAYRRLMFSEIAKFLHNEADIEDVQQESIIRLMGKIGLLRTLNRDKTVNYIITTCHHTALNFIRASKHTSVYSFDEGMDSAGSELASEDLLIHVEQSEDFRRAWEALDEKNRHVLEMRYVLGLSDAAVAREYGISEASVRMLMSRARGKLGKLMGSS